MSRTWTLSLLVAAALGLQACDQQAPRTTVTAPQSSLPDDAVLQAPAGPAAPDTAAAPVASASAPVESAAAPAADAASGASAAPNPDPGVAAPAGAGSPTAQTQPTTSGDNPVPPQASADPAAAAASPGATEAAAPPTGSMGAAASVPDGSAAPTELSRFFSETAPSAAAPAATGTATPAPVPAAQPSANPPPPQFDRKVSALPAVRNPGDLQGAQMLAQRTLAVPVVGIQPDTLTDQYEQDRGARKHEAIDLLAPSGTPVVAVDDGRIVKLFNSKAGGLTIYHFDPGAQLAYYYAHLQRYAAGVREGMEVRRGDVIGYVGVTGNSDANTPHLHFAVFRLGNPPRWWEGEPVNPYPALSRAQPADQVAVR